MKIEIVRLSRRPPWPLWAVLVVVIWAGVGASTVGLSSHLGRPVQLCLLKRLTGFACPTCGSTRGVLSFVHGHPIRAWLYNPLLFSILGVFFAATAVRIIFACGVRIRLSRRERRFAWIAAIVLFLVNWTYVIFYVG